MRFTSETNTVARRTGAGVITVFGLALAATLLIAGIDWRPYRHWQVYGTFESGVSGLKPGSVVRVGGAVMGEVIGIEIDRTVRPRPAAEGEIPQGPTTGGFLITFELDAEVQLRTDAKIVLDQNALSGQAELDIVSIGGGRSAPIPGPLPASAQRARRASEERPFTFTTRGDAATRILGRAGARDLKQLRSHLPGIEAIFIDDSGPHDPRAGSDWGPVRGSRIDRLGESITPLRERIEPDLDAWRGSIESIRARWSDLAQHAEPGATAPRPLERLDQLRAAFDDQRGLRAVWRQLTEGFTRPQSTWTALRDCLGPLGSQWSLLASNFRGLLPEIRDGLLVTKVGFAIGVAELWIMTGPELVTSLVRMFQPFGREEQNAMTIILAANRAAESAESLRAAIEASQWAVAEGAELVAPETADRLTGAVAPALARYRRDLDDLMRVLDAAAARSR